MSPIMIDSLRDIFYNLFLLLMSVSLFLIISRLKEGPALADRVAAIDLFSTLILSAIAFTAVLADDAYFFDVAIILALFSFLGTAIFARLILRQAKDKDSNNEQLQ